MKAKGLHCIFSVFCVALLLAGCGGGGGGGGGGGCCVIGTDTSFPFTNDDGIPELREFPNFSPLIVSRGSSVTVDVHVDTDTTEVQVDLGMYDSVLIQTFLTIDSGVRSVTPGAVNGITILVPFSEPTGTYVARIATCLDDFCVVGTSVGRSYVPFAIYQIFDLAAGSFLGNIFDAPTEFTVQ